MAIFAISLATVSNSCSSRCFITWAAASGPMMTRSVASFCTFVILETSSGAALVSAGAAMINRVNRLVAFASAGQPGTDGLGHVGGVLFDESVEDFDGHDAGLRLVVALAWEAAEGFGLVEGNADGDVIGRGSFQQLEKDQEDDQRQHGEEGVLAHLPVELPPTVGFQTLAKFHGGL